MNLNSRLTDSTYGDFDAAEEHNDHDIDPPPAYSPLSLTSGQGEQLLDRHDHDDTKSLADTSSLLEREALIKPTKPGSPGFATEAALKRGLQIPSKSRLITSGFEYPTVLTHYNVLETDWARFTSEITNSAALSRRQWTTAIGKGLGTLAVGGLLFGIAGAVPAVIVAHKVRENRERQNLAKAMSPGSTSSLPWKIQMWNESYFKPRGIMIRVDLPYEDVAEIDFMDVSTSDAYRDQQQHQQPSPEETRSRRFSRELRTGDDEDTTRAKASRRGRIVIIPLRGDMVSVSGSPSTMSFKEQEDDNQSQSSSQQASGRHNSTSPVLHGRGRPSRYESEPLP